MADHLGLAANFSVFAALNLVGAVLVCVHGVERTPPMRRDGRCSMGIAVQRAGSTISRNPALRAAFAIGFCILFAFIGTFTYVNFVLVRPPFGLGMMALGLVYFVFLPSIVTTPLAGTGRRPLRHAADLLGFARRGGAGLPLLLSRACRRAGRPRAARRRHLLRPGDRHRLRRPRRHADRRLASGLYLASYFLGGLVGSAVLGQIFDRLGWPACVAGIGLALLAGMGLTRWLDARR